jgi:hypothetical protein
LRSPATTKEKKGDVANVRLVSFGVINFFLGKDNKGRQKDKENR